MASPASDAGCVSFYSVLFLSFSQFHLSAIGLRTPPSLNLCPRVGLGKVLLSDKIVEPSRAPLIPGMEAVKKAARDQINVSIRLIDSPIIHHYPDHQTMSDDAAPKQPNGVVIDPIVDDSHRTHDDLTLLNRLIAAIFSPDPNSSAPLPHRLKTALSDNIRDASNNTAAPLLQLTRSGSPLRALLVVSVGTIAFLALAGLLVFTLFFVAATVNAVVISLVMSLAAAGGFLALFFACVAAIYIGALSVAIFVISTATISCVFAVLIAAGSPDM
ncbi:hypothetical protein SASPL_143764 [Salvia splendens]|uniref:Transmembrane protein n=1 Tax=Salvia splendens TaxID=180675 RepID=A0A8X8WN98_SALSN|nr:hypothetical protein SASPL_143764 [Salvia splendens]